MTTDHNEALRLAEAITDYSRRGFETEEQAKLRRMASHKEAAALLRQQAERIAELEKEISDLHTTMMAAAVEIQEHWGAHCDAEGYGPANLMHRLERGIASQYGYDAKTLLRVQAERDQLRAEVERLHGLCVEQAQELIDRPVKAIDHARTTHKDEG